VTDYLAEPLLEDLRPAERPAVAPEVLLALVLPLNWEAFFAATGMLLRPFVVLPDFKLLVFSLAIFTNDTFFLTEISVYF